MNHTARPSSKGAMQMLRRRALPTLLACLALSALCATTAFALRVGARAPEIGLEDMNGRRVTIGSLRGKVVLVDIWASWCEPCAAEMPVLERLYRAHRGDGFTVVGVSVDSERGNIDRFFQRHGRVSFPVVHDPSGRRVARAYGTPAMPTSYLIDRNGVVRHVHAGFRASDAQALEREIRALLAER